MAYIFLDESGDLGFNFSKKRTSNYFVVTFLFTQNKRPIEKVVKKVFKSLPDKVRKKHSGCLHAVKEKPHTRLKLLNLLTQEDIAIFSIYLNKRKVYTKLQDEKHVLYNYVTNILLDRLYTKKLVPLDKKIHLVASKRETNRFLNENFQTYLQSQIESNHKLAIDIEIKPSHSEKCLQAVDFACWAIFRHRETNDESYKNVISSKIIEESPLFP